MNLINVTSWSARKLHLADPSKSRDHTWGSWLPTLCDAQAVVPGDRWVRHHTRGPMRQDFIDALEPCKKCAKRRSILEETQP